MRDHNQEIASRLTENHGMITKAKQMLNTTPITLETTLETGPMTIQKKDTATIQETILEVILETETGITETRDLKNIHIRKKAFHHGEIMVNKNSTHVTGTKETGQACTNASLAGQFMS